MEQISILVLSSRVLTLDSSLNGDDYDSFVGAGSGWDSDDVTTYADEYTSGDWDESGYNSITLNSTAITDLQSAYTSGDRFKVVYMIHNDYDDTEPSTSQVIGVEWVTIHDADSDKHPYLELTYSALSPAGLNLNSGQVILKGGNLIIK